MDNQLEDQILKEIAMRFPYSLEDVRSVYYATGSIDATIKACETAVRIGVGSCTFVIELAMTGRTKPGPSEYK